MKNKVFLFCILQVSLLTLSAQTTRTWGAWDKWGEQPDGTYLNPVIPADYSDLDCIRVGDDYYAISSTMQYSPGMTILHSRDLVNWEIAGNAVSDLSEISPALTWQQMDRYGRGIWAGTLRHHDGRFYLYFGTPDEGFFMTSATKAEGPWDPLTCLLAESGWDDCSVIWDEDGDAWFIGTCFREGYKTYLFRMVSDGRSIHRSTARLVNEGYGREANKLIYHDGYYYLIFSEHRDGVGRYVMAKRDRLMTGIFSEERQLLLPCREAHEPNQGGIIEGPDGKWYFLTHHGDGDWSGRIVSLLPVTWQEGWPMMGELSEAGTPGGMVWGGVMPVGGGSEGLSRVKEGSDYLTDFDGEKAMELSSTRSMTDGRQIGGGELPPYLQWNYQPRAEWYSLSERPGWLRLKAFRPLEHDKLLKAGNTLTQRSFRTPHNEVTVRIDISQMADGQHAGLCHLASHSGSLGVMRGGGTTRLELRHDNTSELGPVITDHYLWLRSTWGLDGHSQFSYSTDGERFIPFGTYDLTWGFYRGDRIGLYNYNNHADEGYVDIDFLHYWCQ